MMLCFTKICVYIIMKKSNYFILSIEFIKALAKKILFLTVNRRSFFPSALLWFHELDETNQTLLELSDYPSEESHHTDTTFI